MIRVVDLRKAAVGGLLGAIAWELALRPLLIAGVPLVDIVRMLGSLLESDNAWIWWPVGMALHVVVGVIWAVFYAYFFWSVLRWPPVWQGVVFSLIPTVLAIALVYPQLYAMLAQESVLQVDALQLTAQVSWGERAGILLGHLAYGAALGASYTHPVGYPVHEPPRMPAPRRHEQRLMASQRPANAFIFATGIECSYPTIENGRWRRDQMAAGRHYERYEEDFDLCAELGASHLRYGPPLHLLHHARNLFDWDFTDRALTALRQRRITPIVDLCHFGLPSWLENFQNAEVPEALMRYASEFARRYPWVRFYTPINEMYVCARLSALDGLWNEQCRDESAFLTAVRHLARANVLMMQAILRERADAVFINSESSELYQPATPEPVIVRTAEFENERRFLPLDLIYRHPVSDGMRQYLRDNGMTADEFEWFQAQETPRRAILGVDYYEWNEKLIDTERRARSLGELFGWYVVAMQYWDRYRRPLMHTETNYMDARQAPRWLWRQWHNVQLIRSAGVPVVGFTWYSLTDQVDWDIALAEARGNVSPVGLFDLNRQPRATAQAYKHLIDTFAHQPGLQECPALAEVLA